jgi:hypothetical protein
MTVFSAERTYLDYDLAQLRMMAEAVGVELQAGNARAAASELAHALQNSETLSLVWVGLSPTAQTILQWVCRQHGQVRVAALERQAGIVRPLGSVAREREQPQRKPASIAEELWYRGLLGRAFVRTQEVEEYFYVPADLLAILQNLLPSQPAPPVTHSTTSPVVSPLPTSQIPPNSWQRANSAWVDDACTVLAFYQCFAQQTSTLSNSQLEMLRVQLRHPQALACLQVLLRELGLVQDTLLRLRAEPAREFLRLPRAQQLAKLAQTWQESTHWHDLLAVPSLLVDETTLLQLQPARARKAILSCLAILPPGEWVLADDLVERVYRTLPDFQRSAAEYDLWYVREQASGQYLRGFASWHAVEGAYIRYLLSQPLHWLGVLDVAGAEQTLAVRSTSLLGAFLGNRPWQLSEKNPPIELRSDGLIVVPRASNRYVRFQTARIGDWLTPPDANTYAYRLSVAGLQRGLQGGIRPPQVRAFLQRASHRPLPAPVEQALNRWEERGQEAQLQQLLILRVQNEAVLAQIRENPRTRRFLGETLGALAVVVRAKDWKPLQQELLNLGILLAVGEDVSGVARDNPQVDTPLPHTKKPPK